MRDGYTISLSADWNGWRSATARLEALRDVHWHRPDGAPQPLLHARVSCADLVASDLPHQCSTSTAPHEIVVCVLRRHNLPDAYAALTLRAKEASCRR